MFRILSITIVAISIVSMSGCVLGPVGGGGHCNSCDGCGPGNMHAGPGDAFRAWRRSLSCGAGCGDTYYDEWYSTPPQCEEPCPEFACAGGCGGACGGNCISPCGCGVAGCGGCGIRPLRAVFGLVAGIYGKRFCGECGHGYDDCCCGGEATFMEGEIIQGEPTLATDSISRSPAHRQVMSRQKSQQTLEQLVRTADEQRPVYRQATRPAQGQAFRR